MALAAVLISFTLATIGAVFVGPSYGVGALVLVYAGLGTLVLIGFALAMAAFGREDKSR